MLNFPSAELVGENMKLKDMTKLTREFPLANKSVSTIFVRALYKAVLATK
jgi:hypothetical protein